MIQRDYMMRLMREFFAALQRILEKKEVTDRREQLRKLYEQYVGPYTLYYEADIPTVMKAMQGVDEERRMFRIEMLAELYYAEADTVGQPDRDFLLSKAFALYDFIDSHDRTFSIDRRSKMASIKSKIAIKDGKIATHSGGV